MEEQFIRDRISKLREQKQVSERKMSLDLGHSTSYIRSITSGRSLPSMSELLYICEYLGVTPMEFFNEDKATTLMQQKAIDYIYSMSDEDVSLMDEVNDARLLTLAVKRMEKFNPEETIPEEKVMKDLGITDDDLSDFDEVEFE